MTKWLKRGALALLVLALLAALTGWWSMRGSLPRLDGELELEALSAPVTVQRDALGVVTIDAANEIDAMHALGYVHAQERYFEMDLMRRTAAGELAELFGPRAIDTDKKHRVHRMRARANQHLDLIAGNKFAQLDAYTDGVNAGLGDLEMRPWPYLLLRQQPKPWLLADSALTGYAMYFDLQDSTNARELALWRLQQHVPAALFALLAHDGSSWDAPLVGAPRGDAVLPSPHQVDLRKLPTTASDSAAVADATLPDPVQVGSNNFAVSGALTQGGRAIVADDMHLGLRAPNIWFRARLRYGDGRASGGQVDVSGFTLPGLPGVVVGSNGHVAWGFTNSYGDWLDWHRQPACTDTTAVDRNAPCAKTTTFVETIKVAGAADETFDVEETSWGPVLQREANGDLLALRWSAHLPGSLNLEVLEFARATSLEDVMGTADRIGLPAQNLVVGDSSGRIAWRLLGPVPQRDGDCNGALVANTASLLEATSDLRARCRGWELQSEGAPLL